MDKFNFQLNRKNILLILLIFMVGVVLGILFFGSGTPLKKQYQLPDFPTTEESPPPLPQQVPPPTTQTKTLIVTVQNTPVHTAPTSQSGVLERLAAQTTVQLLDTKVFAVSGREYTPTEAVINKEKIVIVRGKIYKLQRGQVVEILDFDGKRYKAQVKFEKAGWIEMSLAPHEITLRKTYDWYQVLTPRGNTGWIYGAFVQ